jgi:hypothetical protein
LLTPKQESLLPVSPAVLGDRTVEQQLQIRWQGGERVIDAALEIEDGRLRLVLMAFGMRVLSLDYDGKTFTQERFVPHAPDGVRILNDLMMIAAPRDELQNALPAGWTLEEHLASGISDEGSVSRAAGREIFADGVKQIEIHYADCFPANPWQGKVTLKNLAKGYELILISHEI